MTTQTLPRTTSGWVGLARSGPDAGQGPAVVAAVYRLWLVAFALKMLGSTWDMSWHFKWLRDDAAPPHLLNTAGTVIVVALVLFQAYHNVGVDKAAKRLMVGGTATFLIAIPIDILNHRINGLDITAWSASHALLYIGTAFMLLGVARGYWISTPPSRARTVVSAFIWGFFLENVLFPSQHQEYGQLSLESWLAGKPTAEPILLQFAADQIGRPVDKIAVTGFALPVDSWVYPAWITGAALLTLVAARAIIGARFTATAIAASYVAYRLVMWGLLAGTGFPKSIPPLLLLAGAIAIDIVFLAFAGSRGKKSLIPQQAGPERVAVAKGSSGLGVALVAAVFGAAVATAATAGATWLQDFFIGTPPIDYPAFGYGFAVLALGWAIIAVVTNRQRA
ncbi:hypothetical protein ACFQZ4_20645 [Catellatospora coxensis]|uniref:Uncharacterized protein n=1 Tax=Catellatospora coxensis TaxID=310354 RepID=A0A8J3PAF8_9ACTN|nr:hypothetical protein [Catellatospora coxensis]GIG10261.1 hypothetical protein Cco03nite_69610 [Catellatospora coxensis]